MAYMHKALGRIPNSIKPRLSGHAYNGRSWAGEARGSERSVTLSYMVSWRPTWASGGCSRIKRKGKEKGEKKNWMKGSREQWMCLLIAAQRWGGAGVGRGHLLSLENSPHGLQHIDHSNPDGLCFSFQCLVTCGKGQKHRQVWCQFGEDRLSDRMCDPEAKPEPMQTCQQPECAAWQAGPWGQVF